jgi:hypothetical protein
MRRGLPLCVPGRRESIVVGEIILGEQTIDGFPERVGVRCSGAKVLRHLVVVLDAIDPSIGDGVTAGRWTSAGRHGFIVLVERFMVSGISSSASEMLRDRYLTGILSTGTKLLTPKSPIGFGVVKAYMGLLMVVCPVGPLTWIVLGRTIKGTL